MVDPVTRARLWHRVMFVTIAALVLLLRLLPLSPSTSGFSGPDITLALTLAWVLRRPEYVPVALIVLVIVVEALLLLPTVALMLSVAEPMLKAGASPVPDSAMVCVRPSMVTERLSLRAPVVVGLKRSVTLQVPPAGMVGGLPLLQVAPLYQNSEAAVVPMPVRL